MTERNYKISLCGNPGVGKTSIAMRQAQNSFPESHQPTLGSNFFIWNTQIDTHDIRLIIADSGSQERFYSILPKYFQGSFAAAIVYDITDEESFGRLDFWIEKLKDSVGDIPFIIVGNKTDLEMNRVISKEDGEKFAEELGAEFFEVSAMKKTNLSQMFTKLARIVINQDQNTE
ncbi:MAG: Rab family GTPase [Candidatus Thorarchaeota archaeon]